jgi:hypothetical protein
VGGRAKPPLLCSAEQGSVKNTKKVYILLKYLDTLRQYMYNICMLRFFVRFYGSSHDPGGKAH